MAAAFTTASYRWVRPEVYPLIAPVALVVGIMGFSLYRNISGHPEVRVLKENRAAGILENFDEGEKHKEHALRKFVRGRSSEVMPGLNNFFSKPNIPS